MTDSEPSLRGQMTDGIEKIRQQLQLLHAGPTIGGPSDDRLLIAELEAELQALIEARARL